MPATQTDVDRLTAAMNSGVKAVTYEGKGTVVYRDYADMEKALARMQNDVNAAAGLVRTRQIRMVTRSGY